MPSDPKSDPRPNLREADSCHTCICSQWNDGESNPMRRRVCEAMSPPITVYVSQICDAHEPEEGGDE